MRVFELPSDAGAVVIVTRAELAILKTAARAKDVDPEEMIAVWLRRAIEGACHDEDRAEEPGE